MNWSIDFDRLPSDAGAWVLLQSVSESAADGYSRQAMRAWNADGSRLLAAMQTVAIFV
jgi:acyl-CoA thioesterase